MSAMNIITLMYFKDDQPCIQTYNARILIWLKARTHFSSRMQWYANKILYLTLQISLSPKGMKSTSLDAFLAKTRPPPCLTKAKKWCLQFVQGEEFTGITKTIETLHPTMCLHIQRNPALISRLNMKQRQHYQEKYETKSSNNVK